MTVETESGALHAGLMTPLVGPTGINLVELWMVQRILSRELRDQRLRELCTAH